MRNTGHRGSTLARIKQHTGHKINQVVCLSDAIVLHMRHLLSELDGTPKDSCSFPGPIDKALHISESLSVNKFVLFEGEYLSIEVSDIWADEKYLAKTARRSEIRS